MGLMCSSLGAHCCSKFVGSKIVICESSGIQFGRILKNIGVYSLNLRGVPAMTFGDVGGPGCSSVLGLTLTMPKFKKNVKQRRFGGRRLEMQTRAKT